MSEPNFLFCVGATKAGTSWLFDQLFAHPECGFRTIKELHYFTMSKPAHFDRALQNMEKTMGEVALRLLSAPEDRTPYLQQRLVDMQAWIEVLRRREIDVPAYQQFLTEGATQSKVVGEMTPAYGLMSQEELQILTRVNAKSKILYLIRDPLARLWSHVRMVAKRNLSAVDFEAGCRKQLEQILAGDLSGEGDGIVQRGDYAKIITKLGNAFPSDRIMVQFQEDMMQPNGMDRLWSFLGLSPCNVATEKVVHAGRPLELSQDLRRRALVWLRPQYEFIASQFPVLPAAWRKNMEEGFA